MKKLRFISWCALLSILSASLYSQTITVSGTVAGVWDYDTVKMSSDITLPESDSLTILPGTVIESQGPYRFFVKGTLIATGTESQPILFTIVDTAELSNPATPRGGWKGFQIQNLNPGKQISFKYCDFEYGKAWELTEDACGGIFNILNSGNITFEHCNISHSVCEYLGGAMYLSNATAEFEQCHFHNNTAGIDSVGYGGAIVSMGGDVAWRHCTFEQNRSNGLGGAMCVWFPVQSEVTNSIFQHNTGSTGGAIFFLNSNNTVFHNNLFTHNNGYFFGGALGMKNCSFPIINCTIADNQGGQGGGIYCSSGVSNPVYNTIISGNSAYGNGQQVYIAYLESTLSFYHSVVESGREAFGGSGGWYPGAYHGTYLNNIEEPVNFTHLNNFDYAIAPPCQAIDNGYTDTIGALIPAIDICGNQRIMGSQIDRGCFEYDFSSFLPETTYKNDFSVYPNPFITSTTIRFEKDILPDVLYILNSKGQIIQKIQLYGQKEYYWDGNGKNGSEIPSGLYFLFSKKGAHTPLIKN